MADKHIIPELNRSELRKFGFVTGAIFVGLFGAFFPWLLERAWPLWPWTILAVLGGLGLVAPEALRPVYKIWMRFGLLVSKVTTPLILCIVFFLVITPIGLISRLVKTDAMARAFNADAPTYRVTIARKSVKNLEKPF